MSAHTNHHHHFSQSPPNPLRPYYIPPPAAPFDPSLPDTTSLPASVPVANGTSSSYGMFQDLQDYSSEYLESPSISEAMRSFLDQAILRYTSALIAQPFEVAKTVLQCQYVPKRELKQKRRASTAGVEVEEEETGAEEDADEGEDEVKEEAEENPWQFDEDEPEESDDEPKYFASNTPDASPSLRPSKAPPATGPKKPTDRAGYVLEEREDIPRPDYQIRSVKSGAVGEAVKALWAKEGAWGIWKGQNATFIYSVAVSTIEAWTASFLSAVLSLPDPGITEIADSTHPLASLGVAITATALTAVILSPLDIIRTKLILTPSTSKPRNLLPALRTLPSYTIPTQLIIPTTLHAVIPSIISLGTPYLLKTKLNLDPLLTPASFNFFSFLSSTVELFVRLPLETLLRRAQIAYSKPEKTIVPVGRYAGVAGTVWLLTKEEETGKWGIEGLYRGWRVGAWGNVGMLGLGLVGVQQQAGEF